MILTWEKIMPKWCAHTNQRIHWMPPQWNGTTGDTFQDWANRSSLITCLYQRVSPSYPTLPQPTTPKGESATNIKIRRHRASSSFTSNNTTGKGARWYQKHVKEDTIKPLTTYMEQKTCTITNLSPSWKCIIPQYTWSYRSFAMSLYLPWRQSLTPLSIISKQW